jgi:predicted MPP superfamily phosphohydrolase
MALAPILLFSLFLHSFIGWRLASEVALFNPALGTALWIALALSAVLMPMGMLARRIAKRPLSTALTWAGLLCMGLFSSLLVLTLLREILLVLGQLVDWLWPQAVALQALQIDSAIALPAVALLITVLGLWNARRTAAVVQVDVPIANLPEALQGFTVAQISDIHVGPTIKTHYLQRIVDRVNGLNANMVAITGDLVDGSVAELGQHVTPLAQLRSTHGSFFVTGNHEYYSGAHSWIIALRALGVNVLMNEHVLIQHSIDAQDPEPALIVVAGVADYSAHRFDEAHRSDPHKAIANAPEHAVFKLLLAHQPRSAAAAADAGFDLQLSGHTHGGQFWPWNLFVPLQQPFTAGLHKLKALWVYTSRGTGYWGPPKRFGAPSEITHLR